MIQLYKGIELETGRNIEGFFYEEAGYWMSCGKPDLNRPVKRHYLVDLNGSHLEVCPTTVKPSAMYDLKF